jgi:hypothetical protein
MAQGLSISIKITVPWPHPHLSPNARVHWAARAKQAKLHAGATKWAALEAIQSRKKHTMDLGLPWDKATIRYTFYQPDNRKRDDDNLLASMKWSRDALQSPPKGAGIIADDHDLTSLEPRMLVDKTRPRVVITVTREE